MNEKAEWFALWSLMGLSKEWGFEGRYAWMAPSTAKALVRHLNGRETRFRPIAGSDGVPVVGSIYDDQQVHPSRWYLLRDFKGVPIAWAYMDWRTRDRLSHYIKAPVSYPMEQIVFTSPTSAVTV